MPKIGEVIPIDHLISKQITWWEERKKVTRKTAEEGIGPFHRPFVTLSQKEGTGGRAIAERLAEGLGWQLFDRQLVDYIAQTARVRSSVIESFDEKRRSELETWVLTLFDREALDADHYFKHLVHVLVTIAEHGWAVIVGRGANFILPADRGLRIQITAPLDYRVGLLAKERGMTETEAKRYLEEADKERLAFVRRYYHRDADDPLNYDVVINVQNFAAQGAVGVILAALEERFGKDRISPGEVAK